MTSWTPRRPRHSGSTKSSNWGRCCTPTGTQRRPSSAGRLREAQTRAASPSGVNCKQRRRKTNPAHHRAQKARQLPGAQRWRSSDGGRAWRRLCRELARAGHRLPAPGWRQPETQERDASATVQSQSRRGQQKAEHLHTDIVRQMGKAKHEDRGALADHGPEAEGAAPLPAAPASAGRRSPAAQAPAVSGIPQQHLAAGRGHLLNGIAAQVTDIEERIAQLNETLQRGTFSPAGICS